MSKYKKHQTEHELANLSWGLIVFLWLCWWPLGVGLTIGKILARKKLEQAEERARFDRHRPESGAVYGEQATARPADAAHTPRPGEYGYRAARQPAASAMSTDQRKAGDRRKWLVPALLILGALFAVGGLGMLAEGIDTLLLFDTLWDGWVFREYLMPGVMSLAGGAGLLWKGLADRKASRQEKLLCTIVGPRDNVSLAELAAASGLGQSKTLKLVQSAIQHGLFGQNAYVDMRSRTLVVRGSAPDPTPDAPAPAPSPAPAAEEDKYQAILRQLRQVNDAIPGQEMSDKISRMETVSARIFALVKKDPAKEPQLQRFMDYYLPTSLKLLNTYATLDQHGIAGENISETKANIENAMDLLVTAFENQLDKLYESDALDVSSDIAALQGMLNLDGLTRPTDFTAPAAQWQKDTEL